jgi:predicted Abi (CAAX) family protease
METAQNQFWHLIAGALALDPDAFQLITTLPGGGQVALIVVFLAGLSQTLGQCVVLFINRVKPIRFAFSVITAALLFAIIYGFWALSTWLISGLFMTPKLPLAMLFSILGLAYAPQLFSVAIGFPYLGVPISILLSIWSLLAIVRGLEVTGLNRWQALVCTGLGWLVLQLLQRTMGKPLVALGRRMMNWAAGTELVTTQSGVSEILSEGWQPAPQPNWLASVPAPAASTSKRWRYLAGLGLMVLFISGIVGAIAHEEVSLWYATLATTLRLFIDLILFSVIALIIAILLTPLEALGWWAGWYGNQPLTYYGELVAPAPPNTKIARYVLFLDGINQGTYNYLPEIENFLIELATALPDNVQIVRGIIPYTVANTPLTENRPVSFVWSFIFSRIAKNPDALLGLFVNIRNLVAVAISADHRYGSVQNQGLAQVMFDSLINHGYQLEQRTPITIIGYSGGGQMEVAVVPYLKRALNAPIELISVAGVISGAMSGALLVEHIFHMYGTKDKVEALGPLMFPSRWPIAVNSPWNQAKRRGKISIISLGSIGHNGSDGPFWADSYLPDGRSHLQQTLSLMTGILLKDWTLTDLNPEDYFATSNYERYQQAEFNQLSNYPVIQSAPNHHYRAIAPWMGRLILPTLATRSLPRQVSFEVYHADVSYQHLVGQTVQLSWSDKPETQQYVQRTVQDVNFVDQIKVGGYQGNIHRDRIHHWQKVDPLESLAGARPEDDVFVMLPSPITITTRNNQPTVLIDQEPIQITGRFYALVTFIAPVDTDQFQVRHYNPTSQQFDGLEEIVYVPSVVANRNGVYPASHHQLEQSPHNTTGWYIYGATDHHGRFVVQALAPRALFVLQPTAVITGKKATLNYINHDYWKNVTEHKGTFSSVLLSPKSQADSPSSFESAQFSEGTRLLVLHTYGGIGGSKAEFAPMGIFFGHFAYGVATVVREPLTQELRFALQYQQIYPQNIDGMVSGRQDWTHYMGDRQFGWLGLRPTADILVHFPPLTENFNFDGIRYSPLDNVLHELDVIAARYRIGEGISTPFVSPINCCMQDATQSVYAALEQTVSELENNPLTIQWLQDHPEHEQTQRFRQLGDLVACLGNTVISLNATPSNRQSSQSMLRPFPIESPLQTMLYTLSNWRSILPRATNDLIAMIFLQLGASLWVLRTNQIGGVDPEIAPIAPTDFGIRVPSIQPASIDRD